MTETAVHGTKLLFDVFIMFAAAKLFAELFTRLRQPTVVGEILAGILIGPGVLGWVAPSEVSHLLSQIGVIILLFSVGLETKPAVILGVGGTAMVVAVLGVIAPFVAGWWLMRTVGDPAIGSVDVEALFVGTAMVATSVGITARALGEMGVLQARASRVILGAAVIDDILGLLVLAAVSSMAQGSMNYARLAWTGLLAVAFVVIVGVLGAKLLNRTHHHIEAMQAHSATFVFAMVLCFGLALAAQFIGVAAIVGGFLAGMALSEAFEHHRDLHEQTRGVTELLVPFFLVEIGMQLKLELFTETETILLALAITGLAVVGKLIGCALGSLRMGWKDALCVGVGMVPRGEVGIVVAQIGLAAGVISERLFGAVLFMAVATTLIAPPVMRPLFARAAERG